MGERLGRWLERREANTLPVLPGSRPALARALERGSVTTSRIRDLVLCDPALSVAMLGAAASGHHTPSPPETVSHAILLMGAESPLELITRLPTTGALAESSRSAYESVASRAAHAGLYALQWAEARHEHTPEHLGVVAALRHLGQLALWAFDPEAADKVEARGGDPAAARAVLGFCYDELGQTLARRLGLAPELCEALAPLAPLHPHVAGAALAADAARVTSRCWHGEDAHECSELLADYLGTDPDAAGAMLRARAAHTARLSPHPGAWNSARALMVVTEPGPALAAEPASRDPAHIQLRPRRETAVETAGSARILASAGPPPAPDAPAPPPAADAPPGEPLTKTRPEAVEPPASRGAGKPEVSPSGHPGAAPPRPEAGTSTLGTAKTPDARATAAPEPGSRTPPRPPAAAKRGDTAAPEASDGAPATRSPDTVPDRRPRPETRKPARTARRSGTGTDSAGKSGSARHPATEATAPKERAPRARPANDAYRNCLASLAAYRERRIPVHEMLDRLLHGMRDGIGFERVMFCMLSSDRERLTTRFMVDAAGSDNPAERGLALSLNRPHLFTRLMKRPQAVWLNDTTHAKLWRLVPSRVRKDVGDGTFVAMSLFVKNKPLGVLYGDCPSDRSAVDAAGYVRFKRLCSDTARALEQARG